MAKRYEVNGVEFTQGEYERIMAAIRLRVQACNENSEHRQASNWNRIAQKIIFAFNAKKGE